MGEKLTQWKGMYENWTSANIDRKIKISFFSLIVFLTAILIKGETHFTKIEILISGLIIFASLFNLWTITFYSNWKERIALLNMKVVTLSTMGKVNQEKIDAEQERDILLRINSSLKRIMGINNTVLLLTSSYLIVSVFI